MALFTFKRSERNPIKSDNQLTKGLRLLAYGQVRQDSNGNDRSTKLSRMPIFIEQRTGTQ